MRLVLLDLDGTLTDSAPGILGSIRTTYTELGLPLPTEQQLRGFVGPPLTENLLGHGVPPERLDEAVAAYRRSYATGMYDNAVYPGIPAALAELRASGARLVVATSKPEPFAVRICAHLDLTRRVDAIAGASMDGVRGTKSQVVARALRMAGPGVEGPPVMVGDREHDVHGAGEHGIATVGAGWGYGAPGELAAAGAVTVVDDPGGLTRAVLSALG
ncbi:HAD hydrolase-like protein [Cellulomonas sp. RIT-PI-Y]|uniref:HAD hydrolase-like protein n=1 Tax=Cellulomonas sp. RIT-PI-Y TaxID=3035297 RepID=UPI0021D8ABC4|nr:HAD hydrolase-like protein [Cellulomonas sp. RIT-PI-Y]